MSVEGIGEAYCLRVFESRVGIVVIWFRRWLLTWSLILKTAGVVRKGIGECAKWKRSKPQPKGDYMQVSDLT